MNNRHNVSIFLLGVLIGVFGGFVLGAFLGKSVFNLATLLVNFINRQSRSDKERMKFELLLQ